MNADRYCCDGRCDEHGNCPQMDGMNARRYPRTMHGADAAFRQDPEFCSAVELPAPMGPVAAAIDRMGDWSFRRWIAAALVAAAIGALLAACGGGDPEPEQVTPPTEKLL